MEQNLKAYCLERGDDTLLRQWHPGKNLPLTPETVAPRSHKSVWWRCEKGHEWQAMPNSRTGDRKRGCPVCAGRAVIPGDNDLKTHFPDLAKQWDGEKNAPLRPDQVTPYSNNRVWWKCDLGHEFLAKISDRSYRQQDCPYCQNRKVLPGFNDLATTDPTVAEEWYQPLNEGLTPEMVTKGSSKRVWWRCQEGHVWKAIIVSRTREEYPCGCPVCNDRVSKKRQARFKYILEE